MTVVLADSGALEFPQTGNLSVATRTEQRFSSAIVLPETAYLASPLSFRLSVIVDLTAPAEDRYYEEWDNYPNIEPLGWVNIMSGARLLHREKITARNQQLNYDFAPLPLLNSEGNRPASYGTGDSPKAYYRNASDWTAYFNPPEATIFSSIAAGTAALEQVDGSELFVPLPPQASERPPIIYNSLEHGEADSVRSWWRPGVAGQIQSSLLLLFTGGLPSYPPLHTPTLVGGVNRPSINPPQSVGECTSGGGKINIYGYGWVCVDQLNPN